MPLVEASIRELEFGSACHDSAELSSKIVALASLLETEKGEKARCQTT